MRVIGTRWAVHFLWMMVMKKEGIENGNHEATF